MRAVRVFPDPATALTTVLLRRLTTLSKALRCSFERLSGTKRAPIVGVLVAKDGKGSSHLVRAVPMIDQCGQSLGLV